MQQEKKNIRIKNSQVEIGYTDKILTSFGGSAAIIPHFLNTIKFKEFIENYFPVQETSNNSSGTYSKIITFFMTILNGGTKFSHTGYLGNNIKVLKQVFSLNKVAKSSTSITRFWGKFDKRSLNEKLLSIAGMFASHIIKESGIEEDSLRFDSTVITRYGEQEGAKRGYNPTKKGRASHQPQIAFLGSGFTANFWNRSGDISSANGIIEFFDQTISRLKDLTITRVLADSGYYSSNLLDHLEDNDYEYVIVARIMEVLQRKVYDIVSWTPVAHGIEVAEFYFQHQSANWSKERRYVVIRQNTTKRKKATGKQLRLFTDFIDYNTYRHSLLVTNNTENTPHEIWNFYKPRSNDENTIENLKSGYGLSSFNLKNFWATEAVLITIALIFHNLIHYLMLKVMNPKNNREKLKSIRLKYFTIPAALSKDGRKYILRLSIKNNKKKNKFITFLRLIDELNLNCNAVQI